MLHNSLCRAAKEKMFQSRAAVRWHHNEIRGDYLCQPTNFIEGRCATEHMALRGRNAAFTCHLLELCERGLFSVLLVWHEGKGDNRRGWCHKIRCVIALTNVGKPH